MIRLTNYTYLSDIRPLAKMTCAISSISRMYVLLAKCRVCCEHHYCATIISTFVQFHNYCVHRYCKDINAKSATNRNGNHETRYRSVWV